ncbi:MAG: guanitoxin biosynthesis heme-dependent pre-guanitoxin N-hydroxylase GntA [Parasphingopyxis sp.]|nr:YqcI/YcgG family protein [Sphingomonadales bacterium]
MQPVRSSVASRHIERRFTRFIEHPAFPCVGAKSAFAKHQAHFYHGRDICSGWDDLPLLQELQRFAQSYRRQPRLFSTFVAIFETPRRLSEEGFEKALWARLQSVHDKDVWLSAERDARISEDPHADNFGLSIGGSGFFVVGLHPRASRKARRFEKPAIVFNLHDQFERLRESGRYEKMRRTILDRDRRWTGSVNPMLARHGTVSEARQYSGRKVGEEWNCPFAPQERREFA